MQYKHIGRTGLQVSRLALGTMNFGMVTDEVTSFAIMDALMRCFKQRHRLAWLARASPMKPALARRGTHTQSAKR
jgi:hypothetical protein